MNCSIAVFSIGDIWQGDSFPEDFVKEIKTKKLDNEFIFCQKREGDLMYYSWSWRNEKINRSIFACYNGFMIDLNEKECFRKIASDLRYIALGDWKTVLPKAQNYLRTSIKLIPLPILSYEKPARKKTFPKFDANELSKYTDTNSTAFVSKTRISEQDKVSPLFVILAIIIIVVTFVTTMLVAISSQEKIQQIIPERNIDRPIYTTKPFQEANYLPASPRTETNSSKQVEKPVDKKTRTTAPIAESHENSAILQNKYFRTELQEVINEWNKSLPIEVEDGIRWVFTSVQGSFCVLHYRVSYEDDFEGLNENFSEVRENIKANINQIDIVEFLQALYRNGFGVKVQFRLRNTDRTIVIAIDARELQSIIER